jgi:hypothetical protein
VVVTFSEAMDQERANTAANYTISPSVSVTGAELQVDLKSVILTTGTHSEGINYTLSVSNVRDASSSGNTISANSIKSYTYIAKLSITNLNVVGSGNSYVIDTLRQGVQYYTDRSFTIQSPVPVDLDGQVMIKTPNDDKTNDLGTVFTLDVNMQVTVYIAVDSRGAADANWMDAYVSTSMVMNTSDVQLKVYKRTAGPGQISFGGNHDSGNLGAQSNYFVILVPAGGSGTVFDLGRVPLNGRKPDLQVRPNPFSTSVEIRVLMRNDECGMMNIHARIYDIKGRQISKFGQFRIPHSAFRNSYIWDATHHPAGSYIVKADLGNQVLTKKVLLIK